MKKTLKIGIFLIIVLLATPVFAGEKYESTYLSADWSYIDVNGDLVEIDLETSWGGDSVYVSIQKYWNSYYYGWVPYSYGGPYYQTYTGSIRSFSEKEATLYLETPNGVIDVVWTAKPDSLSSFKMKYPTYEEKGYSVGATATGTVFGYVAPESTSAFYSYRTYKY